MYFIDLDSNTSSRIDMTRYLEWTDNCYDPFSSYLINNIKRIPYQGSYRIDQEEGRAELLSYNLYGKTDYWWFLLIYNDKICPFDLKRGEYIKYPSMDSIEDFYTLLKTLQRDNPLTSQVRYF